MAEAFRVEVRARRCDTKKYRCDVPHGEDGCIKIINISCHGAKRWRTSFTECVYDSGERLRTIEIERLAVYLPKDLYDEDTKAITKPNLE